MEGLLRLPDFTIYCVRSHVRTPDCSVVYRRRHSRRAVSFCLYGDDHRAGHRHAVARTVTKPLAPQIMRPDCLLLGLTLSSSTAAAHPAG